MLLSIAIGGCATPLPHQSKGLSDASTIGEANLVSVVPDQELSVRREFVASKTNAPLLGLICLPCMAAASGRSEASQKKLQAVEDRALLPVLEQRLDGYRTRVFWEEGLRASAAQASDMTFSTVEVVDRSSSGTKVKAGGKDGVSRPLVFVELDHFLSQDLDKLRMQARARLFDGKGKTKFDTYFFFLPPSVPGATKKDAIDSWSQDRGERYRRSSELGVRAILDALHVTLMSHGQSAAQGVKDAGEVLSRRSCYAGDFEVGIPLKAYDGGSIIATREDYWIIRLVNNDVLIIPACER